MQAGNDGIPACPSPGRRRTHGRPSEGAAAPWNAVRCREGGPRGHVESYFLKLNDRRGPSRLLGEGHHRRPRRWRAARGGGVGDRLRPRWPSCRRQESVPLSRARFGDAVSTSRSPGFRITPRRVSGEVTSGDERIAFDLRIHDGSARRSSRSRARACTRRACPARSSCRRIRTAASSARTPRRDGPIDVDGWHGMQGHNWGTRHAGALRVEPLQPVGRPRRPRPRGRHRAGEGRAGARAAAHARLRAPSRRALRLQRARHAAPRARQQSSCGAGSFSAKNALATVSGELWASTRDFVGLAYENPDGAITYCLNSKIARGRIRLSVRGKPDVEALTRAAALEVGTKDPAHGVTMLA